MTERELLKRLDVWYEYDTEQFAICDEDLNVGKGDTELEAFENYIRRQTSPEMRGV